MNSNNFSIKDIVDKLKNKANSEALEGMARYGMDISNRLGVSIPILRELAKEIGKDHRLAMELWEKGIDETKILASMIAEENKFTEKQAEEWVADFNSWDVCDQICMNLFKKLPFAEKKIREWSKREEEFVRRAAFSLIACIAVYDKEKPDNEFVKFLPLIKKTSTDERNYVKKAVSWALRNIGKKNKNLNKEVTNFAKKLEQLESKSSKWIARDTLRDIQRETVQNRWANPGKS